MKRGKIEYDTLLQFGAKGPIDISDFKDDRKTSYIRKKDTKNDVEFVVNLKKIIYVKCMNNCKRAIISL